MMFALAEKILKHVVLPVICSFWVISPLQAQVFDMVVAQDGSGDYPSIQSAIERVDNSKETRTLIFIKNGEYNEKVRVYSSKKNLSLIGESMDGVIISWDDYSGKTSGMSTANSYTFLAEGDDFYAENITIRNTAGNVGQAVAIRTTGDRQVFKNCQFLGFQDTYYAHKNRQYNLNCYIEGATDFIFGDATTVFEDCTINCVKGGQYITAPNDTKLISTTAEDKPFYHGLLFLNSTITADDDVPDNSYYLGRPWGAPASAVYINCEFGSHIRPEGWSEWDNNNHLNGTFAEYQSRDLAGELIDTSQRVEWSEQLSSEEVDEYYNLDYFLKKDELVWDPRSITVALPAPEGLENTSYVLQWEAVDQAMGYVISRNDTVTGFSTTHSFSDTTADAAVTNTYHVQAVTETGNLSEPSATLTVEATITHIKNLADPGFNVSFKEGGIFVSEKVDVQVYTLSGALVKKEKNTKYVSLPGSGHRLFYILLENKKGDAMVKKIAL